MAVVALPDVGDVSWVVPTVQTNVCCYAAGTALHSWQAVAQGKASIAHKGMLTAAKVMACTGADLLEIRNSSKRLIRTGLEELDWRDVSESASTGSKTGTLVKT